jgi:hypothetical protein
VRFFSDGETGAIGTAPIAVVDGHNVASVTISRLPVGVNTVTAVYAGDDNFGGSTAGSPVAQIVSERR